MRLLHARILNVCHPLWGFPGGNSGKELVCQCRKCGLDPQVEKIPWKQLCNPLQYSCLENLMDRGAWQTIHSVSKSRTQLKQLSNHQPRNKIIYMPTKHVSKPTLKPNFEVSFLWACPGNNYYKFQNPKREQMLHAKRVIFAMYYSGFKSSSGYFSSFFFFFVYGGYYQVNWKKFE